MNSRRTLLLLFSGLVLLFSMSSVLQAQRHMLLNEMPNITLTASVIPAQVFYVSDAAFDFREITDVRRGPVLFTMTINSDQDTEVILKIEINADVQAGQTRVNLDIFSGISKPVELEANRPRVFSSRDLGREGVLSLDESEYIDLDDPRPEVQRIIDVIRATGRLPDGDYNFRITTFLASDPGTPYIPPFERTISVFNPTRVDLLSPLDGEIITTPVPLFQWRSDTRAVILRVFEWRSDQRTRDEAITGVPYLERTLTQRNQLAYPQSGEGVRALEPGRRYVWFVDGVYRTSANVDETIRSDIYSFRIADQSRQAQNQAILNQLELLLGTDFEDILEQIAEEGYELTDHIMVDGNRITIGELLVLINAIRAGENNASLTGIQIIED